MIEEKEELQGQLIASGQIVGSIVGCKGEKGDPGEPGSPGSPGTPGQDGFSPIASISKTGKIATITITDSQGTTTAEIRDGEDGSGSGDMRKETYDTNNNGIVDNAEKVNNHTVGVDVPADAVFTDTTYTAGTGIDITNGIISNTQTSAEWGNISGTLADQTDLNTVLGNKIDKSNTTGLVKNDGTIDTTTYSTFSGSYNDLSNKPTIPDELADLSDDSTHRVVTDTEKNTWSGKQDALVSGTNIKTINSTSLLGSGNLDVGANVSTTYSTSETDTYACSYINGIVQSGSNANGYYTKYADGTLICRYYAGPITTNANSGTTTAVTFPYEFINTDWQIQLTMTNGQAFWSYVFANAKDKTKTGFNLDTYNNSNGNNSGQYFDYIVIGRWK